MSTVDNIFVLHGLISHILNQGEKLYCAFIDFTKAFDYVVRDNLWYTLWPHQKTLSVLKYKTHTDNFTAAGFPSFELSIDYSLYLKTSDRS